MIAGQLLLPVDMNQWNDQKAENIRTDFVLSPIDANYSPLPSRHLYGASHKQTGRDIRRLKLLRPQRSVCSRANAVQTESESLLQSFY
jgi:hypothetical protein